MKKSILNLLGSVILAIPMLFSSCGNGDNALEEIINGNSNSALSNALNNAKEITVDMALLSQREYPIKVYFKKDGNSFMLQKVCYDDIDCDFSEVESIDDVKAIIRSLKAAEIIEDDRGEEFLFILSMFINKDNVLAYSNSNQLKLLLKMKENGPLNTRAVNSEPVIFPILAVNFDLANNKYEQYTYPFLGGIVFKGLEIDGENMTPPTDYEGEADVYVPLNRGNTRSAGPTAIAIWMKIFYDKKNGETWTEINNRYKAKGGYALLMPYDENNNDAFNEFSGITGYQTAAYLCMGVTVPVPFWYTPVNGNGEFELTNISDLVFVKFAHKAGFTADGTANPYGYLSITAID